MLEARKGLLLGVAAYLMWGAFPLYWPLLEPAGAFEILAHRVLWSLVTMGLVVVALRRGSRVRALARDRRVLALLVVSAASVTVNWAMYIWGVNNGRVVEASLGYFINPLVTVLMGVLLLGERVRRPQWLALGVGLLAVLVLTWDYGRLPWLALVLALSFGIYGLAKKTAGVGAIEGLAAETLLIAPFAATYLAWLGTRGDAHFGSHGAGHAVLLMTTGIVTAIPLLCFGAAATRIPLVSLGLLQYLAPILQFGLGVFWFHEDMPAGRWAGFALVWLALTVLTVDAVRHRSRQLALAARSATAG
ncbi:EamA family transporter RarD [Nocardioides sp. cx-173]|uniref:EamA family transporter RarD n=1 Tax=Nocardioides sp. cx-173 TaxID=2898796 RepID=UPI001E3D8B97|nr:EamA family transporter RarD [Nocardioides sp. cx-173]MCD4524079.1 EamA family transporter RarD [Nocardioides sp. cx-173]UGB41479.1 EamA family transporter RarD [Nocardioides sp. cx-173]